MPPCDIEKRFEFKTKEKTMNEQVLILLGIYRGAKLDHNTNR